jgi:hypothetical protein
VDPVACLLCMEFPPSGNVQCCDLHANDHRHSRSSIAVPTLSCGSMPQTGHLTLRLGECRCHQTDRGSLPVRLERERSWGCTDRSSCCSCYSSRSASVSISTGCCGWRRSSAARSLPGVRHRSVRQYGAASLRYGRGRCARRRDGTRVAVVGQSCQRGEAARIRQRSCVRCRDRVDRRKETPRSPPRPPNTGPTGRRLHRR